MKLPRFETDQAELGRFSEILRGIMNGNLSTDNFQLFTVEGTTSGTADTEKFFNHGNRKIPVMVLPKEGDIYLASGGTSNTSVDVRSTKISEPFKLLLFF